jgi:hypothetical protein
MFLLTVGLEQLSSYDPLALRRGLRHIEALVAQLTLPLHRGEGRTGDDEKLVEFLQLQDSFEWNGNWVEEMSLTCSLSTITYLVGPINCQGDE